MAPAALSGGGTLPSARGAAVAPLQAAAWSQAWNDVTAHVGLDDQFSKVKAAIEGHSGLLGKQAAVRVRNWLKKLSEETANVVWKKNRNAYARLLLEQLRCGKLGEPFGGQPPGGPLPTLPKHLAYAFKTPRASGSPRAAAGGAQEAWQEAAAGSPQHGGWQPAAVSPQRQQRARQQQQQQQPGRQANASEQLDDYLGRAAFRRAQHADEQAHAAAAMAAAAASAAALERLDEAGGLQYLPGTRVQLRGAEGRRVDKHQLNDVGWQPSKLELEAQLGASRERQAELEWRLGQMEGLVRQHAALLQGGGAAAPLGSLLNAIDDGHVSPPRNRSGKKELDDLIERYEAKRRQWQAGPAWTAPRVAAEAQRPPPIAYSDEAEILLQLDNFQRGTETIRRQLGGGGGGGDGGGGYAPSSVAAHASAGSQWEDALERTPLRQRPTGLLRSGDYTPGRSMDLFDGLPPSPAVLAASRAAGNRHVRHAGHHLQHSSSSGGAGDLPQQTAQHPAPQQPSSSSTGGRPGASPAGAPTQQQRPRSPIGLEVRHTKKSAAAAERASAAAQPSPGAAAALARLKSKRQSAAGALSPAAAAPAEEEQQQEADTQGRQLQHDEGVQVRQDAPWLAADVGVQAPTPPAAAPLPPDSNAAVVAEVRQLRAKLLASLQKHAPAGSDLLCMAGGGGIASSSGLSEGRSWQREQQHSGVGAGDWRQRNSGVGSDDWRLPAVSAAAAAPPSVSRSSLPSEPPASRWAEPAAPPVAAGSSSKFMLTDDSWDGGLAGGAGRQRLSDLPSGADTPGSLLSGRDASLARLSSLDAGASLSLGHTSFDLSAFESQTEALRLRLAGL